MGFRGGGTAGQSGWDWGIRARATTTFEELHQPIWAAGSEALEFRLPSPHTEKPLHGMKDKLQNVPTNLHPTASTGL